MNITHSGQFTTSCIKSITTQYTTRC